MAALVEKQFPGFGTDFKALGIAAVAVNEMVGPVLFKIAIDSTGESRPPVNTLDEATRHSHPPDPPPSSGSKPPPATTPLEVE